MTGGHLAWYPTCFSLQGLGVRLTPLVAIRTAACVALVASLAGAPALTAQASGQTPPVVPATPVTPPTTPAQPQSPAATVQTPVPPDSLDLPVDLARIKRGLDRNSTTKLDETQLRFYLEIIARQPTFKDFIGSTDLKNGPVKNAQMTHQEFLDMVTPKLLHSSAGFTATETLQVSLVNWVAQTAIKKAVTALRNARNDDEIRAIRAQIDRELAALRGGGE